MVNMKKRKTLVLIAVLALLIPAGLAAAEGVVGSILYMEGTVDVSHRGAYLNWSDVDIGLDIENFDVIETGPDGYVELEIRSPVSGGSVVKVAGDTSFYVEAAPRSGGRQSTTFELMRGSLSLKVSRLAGNESLDVSTETTVMGVRGTEFTVTIAPDRGYLVTVPEGKVACTNPRQEAFAEPGTVCEWAPGGALTEVAVPVAELEAYTEKWRNLRLEALRIDGRLSTRYYAGQYSTYLPQFLSAGEELERNAGIFARYAEYMEAGEMPPMSQATMDKMTVSRGIFALRSALPVMEQIYYALVELEKWHGQGVGTGDIGGEFGTTQAFYRTFNRQRDSIRTLLVRARWYYRVYGYIDRASTGGLPGGGLDAADILNSSPF